jgi:hypothetical protein
MVVPYNYLPAFVKKKIWGEGKIPRPHILKKVYLSE